MGIYTTSMVSTLCTLITGWLFQTFFFHFIYGIILPIHELHHVSSWLLHHQADLSGAEPGSLGFSAAALDFQMGPVDSMVFNFNSLVQKNDFMVS